VPIILFALLLFVLLAFGGVVLLSLAMRYRAGTARGQGRRWVATMNVWMTSFSAVLFLFFTFLISFWLGPTLRFALGWYGLWRPSRLDRFGVDPLGNRTGRTLLHSEPLARASRYAGDRSTFYLRLVAHHAPRRRRSRQTTLADNGLGNSNFPRSRCRLNRVLFRLRDRSTYST
jgi:hypothetical protein